MSAGRVLVLPHRDQLDRERLHSQVVVVLDVIFATSAIVGAFEAGVREVIVTHTEADARALAADHHDGEAMLGGEKDARLLPGFAHFSPCRLQQAGVRDRVLIYTTTNGTPALLAASAAHATYAGSLRNRAALAAYLSGQHPGAEIVLVCAGSAGGFSLEDFYGAGAIVAGLREHCAQIELTDSARAAVATFSQYPPAAALHESRVGRLMQGLDLHADIDFSAELDVTAVLPRLRQGTLRDISRDASAAS